MKHIFIVCILFLTISSGWAQTKAPSPKDTTTTKTQGRSKPQVKVDTLLNVKFPILLQSAKFDKIDSADQNITSKIPVTRYGFVDTADLKLKVCDFEKEANAMVLFDRAELICGSAFTTMERHKRIKIFNDNGKQEANIRIEYNNRFGREAILAVEAETITLVNGKIEYTKLDPKLIYGEHTDKNKDAVVFSMPNVKAGSVIEYRYVWQRDFSINFPGWDFQCDLPTRYSQLDITINPFLEFNVLYKKRQPFVRDTSYRFGLSHSWALADVPSTKVEAFMRAKADAVQSLTIVISAVRVNGKPQELFSSWETVGREIAEDKEMMRPFDQSLHDEDELIKQAKAFKTDDERIEFLFNQVKSLMKWNEEKNWVSRDGIKSAWKKKSGNWSEINMILCRLLKQSGVKAYPMLVSTRDNGKMTPDFVNIYQINQQVTYVPVDSTKCYVLDASDKFNSYNEIPFGLLNSYGLCINKEQAKYSMILLKKNLPAKKVVFINADINTDGSMKGTAQINSQSYFKSAELEIHKLLDEKKYREYLTDADNNLKITTNTFENAEVDSLPLFQQIDFRLDLPGTDDKYIYFSPNLFTSLHNNPFISETRDSEVDFGCNNVYSINGRYKIPDGYKVDVMPKTMNLLMEDKTILFKRVIGEQEGYILVNYVISYKKPVYPASAYPEIYAYFKKMHEVLNEQIVLKKL